MLLREKLEEVTIYRRVKKKMEELNCDFTMIARLAHIYHFGTDPDQTQTFINWTQHGIVPAYVKKWLDAIDGDCYDERGKPRASPPP